MATPDTLTALLHTLTLSLSSEPDHALLLSHSTALLTAAPSHPLALHTKIVALLNLDRYADAWPLLQGPAALGQGLVLERAYCAYKLGRLEEALQIARAGGEEGGGGGGRGVRHVEAQAAYRLENFTHASAVYATLSASGAGQVENEDYDMSVNISATDAQLLWSGKGGQGRQGKVDREALAAFETAFNAACLAVAGGELGAALVVLKRALDLCEAMEDLSEEERAQEAAPVLAQQVYVLAKMGRVEEAVEVSRKLDVEGLTDVALKLIATNNEIAASSRLPDYNPHASLRVAAAIAAAEAAPTTSSRPFLFQSRALERNVAALNLAAGKFSAVKSATAAHAKTYPHDHANGVLRAAATANNLTGTAAQNKITKLLAADPTDIGLALTLVQLQLRRNNTTGALQTLHTLTGALPEDQRHTPGLVGLQVAIHTHLGQKAAIKSLLDAASAFWSASPSPNASILRACGAAQLHSTDPDDLLAAGAIFADLLAADPADKLAACGLVAGYATTEPARVTPAHLAGLPDAAALTAGIDAAELEALGVAQQQQQQQQQQTLGRRALGTRKVRAVQKKRKRPVPEELLGRTPDPERWLPVRDRSTYRPKGKKRRGGAAAGAMQGGAGGQGAEESMEMVGGGRVDVKKVGVPVVAGGGGGGQGKKKKKKGGKW